MKVNNVHHLFKIRIDNASLS